MRLNLGSFKWRKTRWGKPQLLFAVTLSALIAIPVWLEFRMGGVKNFGFSVQRLVYGTSLEGKPSKQEIEARIIDILSHDNISEGVIVTTSSAFFEQCVLVRRTTGIKTTCPNVSFEQSDRRIDLRFLRTQPIYADVRPPSTNPRLAVLGAMVTYEFEQQVSDRLHKMNVLSNVIVSEESRNYPKDIDARIIRINERQDNELIDKVYEDASRVSYYCTGNRSVSPDGSWKYGFTMGPSKTEEFVDLIHLYKTSYCAE